MVQITIQKALQNCGKLGFCYLCGKPFQSGDDHDRDHVPPKAIFLPEDRIGPLILPTHSACNQGESVGDELVSQLVSAHHKKLPRQEQMRLKFIGGRLKPDGEPIAFTENLNLVGNIWRWVRGFHAALFGELLPKTNRYSVHPPFPSGRKENDQLTRDPILLLLSLVPEVIKKNRIAKNLDILTCYNGKCHYESVFVRADNDEPMCFWALRLYDWERLADQRWAASRGCIGGYHPPAGIPENASKGTKLDFPFPNTDPLDPFEE